jgi:hypothetical protein
LGSGNSPLARDVHEMAADIRHIREVLAAMQVALRFAEERRRYRS